MPQSHDEEFDLHYFSAGPYRKAARRGISRYFGQFYWARRYYAELVKRYRKEGDLLEVGCGFGDQIGFLSRDFRCVGIDISSEAIEIARGEVNARFEVMRAEEIDLFGSEVFDVIVANNVFEHLVAPDVVIGKCLSLLRPRGYLFFVVPNPSSLMRKVKSDMWVGLRDNTHVSLFEPGRWAGIVQANGFSILATFGTGFWDVPYVKYVPNILQLLIFDWPGIVQTVLGLRFLPVRLGEDLVVVAQKN